MSNKAYLIKRIEELEAKKKALEESEKPVEKTSDPEPADMPEPEKSPLNPGEKPASLRGMSALDIELAFIDGCLSNEELKWCNSLRGPDNWDPHPQGWMRR
jgi:hypothetical protein